MIKKNDNQKAINNIKMLGIDAIHAANSGHPGIVLGIAPIIYQLFKEHLNFKTSDPYWLNRDKFVLSAGHGSALLYSVMFYFGYEDIKLNDIEEFRQMSKKTPGHPERWCFKGIEATTGPLGQGIGQATGMALAQKWCHQNIKTQSKQSVIDSWVYVLCGDGDLEEGISYESMSFAGHNKLDNLIIIYDSNKIQLDGKVSDSFSEDIKMRVKAQNFDYYYISDSNNIDEFSKIIIEIKKKTSNKPSFIQVNSIIGEGTLLKNTNKVHGAPLNDENIEHLKKSLKWQHPPFYVDEEVKKNIQQYTMKRTFEKYKNSELLMNTLKEEDIKKYSEITNNAQEISFEGLIKGLKLNQVNSVRNLSADILNNLFKQKELLLGGSADLSCSTKIAGKDGIYSKSNISGKEIAFGVREFAMGTIATGINCTKLLRSYCSTFFTFSDYLKPSIRLTAISKIPTVYIFSHDSIFVGEDGPTHQPVEQLTMIRSIPEINVWRPYNLYETAAAFKIAFESKSKPTVIITSRQDVQNYCSISDYDIISKGGYIISAEENITKNKVVIIASGSEVDIALKIQNKLLKEKRIQSRVVSVPSLNNLLNYPEYLSLILFYDRIPKIVIEASNDTLWWKILDKNNDHIFNIKKYGYSGKAVNVAEKLNFNINSIMKKLKIYYNF